MSDMTTEANTVEPAQPENSKLLALGSEPLDRVKKQFAELRELMGSVGSALDDRSQRRMQLIWRTIVFQVKLAADSIFDLILSPVSIGAAILGLVRGGDQPDRYLRDVQRIAYRAERWLNLSGHYRSEDNADSLLAPIEARLQDEYARGGWVTKSADQMNTMLDSLKAQPGGEQHIQNAVGNYIAQADHNSTATVNIDASEERSRE